MEPTTDNCNVEVEEDYSEVSVATQSKEAELKSSDQDTIMELSISVATPTQIPTGMS